MQIQQLPFKSHAEIDPITRSYFETVAGQKIEDLDLGDINNFLIEIVEFQKEAFTKVFSLQ